MIEKIQGYHYVTCDACGAELEGIYYSFEDAVEDMRDNDWKSVNVGGVWQNYCPHCALLMIRPGAGEFAGI